MKQDIILWTGAIIIVFLAGYLSNVTGPYYPVSGTIGIEGEPVTFKFDKIYRGNDGYEVIVRTDIKGIKANLLWRGSSVDDWQRTEMSEEGKVLAAKLPWRPPGSKINYRVELNYKEKQYYLPEGKVMMITLWGKVNVMIMQLFYFMIFGGLILAVRTGLEVFKEKPKTGTYTVFTLIFFFLYSICIIPLVRTYELNAINHIVPRVSQLITMQSVSLVVLWIAGMILIFNIRGSKVIPLTVSALTIVVYILIHN